MHSWVVDLKLKVNLVTVVICITIETAKPVILLVAAIPTSRSAIAERPGCSAGWVSFGQRQYRSIFNHISQS